MVAVWARAVVVMPAAAVASLTVQIPVRDDGGNGGHTCLEQAPRSQTPRLPAASRYGMSP